MTSEAKEAAASLADDPGLDAVEKLASQSLSAWSGRFTDLKLIKHRENSVFSAVRDGSRVVIRVHRPNYHDEATVRSELMWVDSLSRSGFDVPPVMPSTSGDALVRATHPDVPEPRCVDMLGWVNGAPIGEITPGGARYFHNLATLAPAIGALSARLHAQTERWAPPPGFRRPAWDEEGLLGPNPRWGRFWELDALDEGQRALLQEARAEARKQLEDYGQAPGVFGLIHSDLVPENLFWDGSSLKAIDFDDCCFSWYLFDLATVLFLAEENMRQETQTGLVRGYRTVRPLSNADISRLPLFMLLRGLTYLGWVQTRSDTPQAGEQTSMIVSRCCALARSVLADPR